MKLGVLLLCALFAAGFLLGVPSAAAQTPPLSYSIRTSGADLSNAQDGDPLRITISGLPANATANFSICPKNLRDGLITQRPDTATRTIVGVPDHSVASRVAAYCVFFNDELSGDSFKTPVTDRPRSAATGDIVLDTSVPRGSRAPGFITYDPEYTATAKTATLVWPANPDKHQYSFTCDEKNPCTMMVKISASGQTVYDDSISFAPSAPGLKVQGCAGVGAGTLSASMPERFGKTAVSWNQMLCGPSKTTQPANVVSETEDAGLASFDKGDSDIAITGAGGRLASQTVRKRQYVPVALNAVVVAAVGWSPTDRADNGSSLLSRLSRKLDFSWDDVANMLSKGGELPDATGRGGIFHGDSALVTRNPALAAISGPASPVQAPDAREGRTAAGDAGYYGVTGEAGKGTVPLRLSELLSTAARQSWVYGTTASFSDGGTMLGGKPVGTVTDLNDLNLGLGNVHNVDAKTGRVNVRKQVNEATLGVAGGCVNGCLNWVVTDLATATEYGWVPVALPGAGGGFVAPAEASLRAAAAHMTVGEDGSLQPGQGAADPAAYPLTFVESLAVPTNPLVDSNCVPQQAKQATLTTLVKAAINGGQGGLGKGMTQLTPELMAQAQDATGKIGTGTADAACQERKTANGPGAGSLGGTGGFAAGGGLPAPPALGPDVGGGAGGLERKAPTQASVGEAKNMAASMRIPLFPGAGALGVLFPLLALVILVGLPALTAYTAAGRPVPPALMGFLRRLDPRRKS
ncbi:hypothetical protein [Amycolatopsis pigmentata]|uniref:PBP domain-containing protein n=1 Tax=Amycolatopsis pigmentata TaxID=450801 RepID=A0ABW5FRH9_9PSEU